MEQNYFLFIPISGDANCPVKIYKEYSDRRPSNSLQPDSRFYLQPNPFHGQDGKKGEAWFINSGMGKNTLGEIAKRMSEDAGFSARHTNHSGRKTCITELLDAKVPPNEVAQISGHKNIMSLNHYNSVSLEKQIVMSTILHGPAASTSADAFDDAITDEEITRMSQKVESTLTAIEKFESRNLQHAGHEHQVIDLPIVHSPSGELRLNPTTLFSNCVFNSSVSIHFK
jgi:hypothetical protein